MVRLIAIHNDAVVSFVVSSSCNYFVSTAFPERIEIGQRVTSLGNSSVQYKLAVLKQGRGKVLRGREFRPCVRRTCEQPAVADSRAPA